MHRILFIVNPISGIGKQKKIEQLIDANLDHELFEHTVVYTEHAHHGIELAQQAAESGAFDALVAVGGDGSVNDVVSGTRASSPAMLPLGIIPCGSGNGLARNLGIPLSPEHAIKIINNFKVSDIDTIEVSSSKWFDRLAINQDSSSNSQFSILNSQFSRIIASIAGIGFDARVARRMKLAKVRGLQAYAKIILSDYPTYKEHTYRLNIDGQEIERKAWFISFANSNQFGYNTAVAPRAKLDDGLIDVCIVDRIPLHHLALTAPLLYLNHFELSQHVEMFKAREVTVYNNEEEWVNIDGEGEHIGKFLHFRNIPKSLKILIP